VARKAVRSRATPRRPAAAIRKAEKGIERLADEIESRLIDAGQVATGTSSAEVNLAAAALEAIEGHGEPGSKAPDNVSRGAARRRAKATRKKSAPS
jgi:hypothetical protein